MGITHNQSEPRLRHTTHWDTHARQLAKLVRGSVQFIAELYSPPVLVRRMVPNCPTAVAVFGSKAETAKRGMVVPLRCCLQLAPPSLVCRITPPLPTAVPFIVSAKEML